MTNKRKLLRDVSAGKFISICLMFFCLVFLTSLNYFLYPYAESASVASSCGMNADDTDNDYPASGPTEEKSSGSGFSILEEFLHENHMAVASPGMDKLFQHKVAEAQKIEMGHPELVSPPPKL